MPQTTFEPQNKVQTGNDYPKLTLAFGERALINCLDPNPVVEYVHTLKAPEIGPDGKILKEVKKNSKGEEYEAVVYEFIGAHLCFGDFGTVSDSGVDPDSCPTCRAAMEEEGILPPSPKYALNVVRYATQPGGWSLRDPYSINVEAWVFAPSRFNNLIDLAVDAGGDLRKHDLRLGPCENAKFHKYDINLVPAEANWLRDPERKKFTVESFQKNKCDDLTALIGRKVDKTKALEDIQTTIEKIQAAYRPTSHVKSAPVVDDPWASTGDTLPSTDTADEAQATVAVEKPAKTGGTMSFADIMNDL